MRETYSTIVGNSHVMIFLLSHAEVTVDVKAVWVLEG